MQCGLGIKLKNSFDLVVLVFPETSIPAEHLQIKEERE
jgi:hypothetical protein